MTEFFRGDFKEDVRADSEDQCSNAELEKNKMKELLQKIGQSALAEVEEAAK